MALLYYFAEFCVLAIALIFLYRLFNPFEFWKKIGVPFIKPAIPIIGGMGPLIRPPHEFSLGLYNSFQNERFFGSFTLWRPTLVVKDPALIENITIKDFSHFYNRNTIVDIDTNSLSKHLVNYNDDKWKALRNKLTPTFSSGKLKGMQPQLVGCAESMVKYLAQFNENDEIEFKDLCGRYSMDVVASCAFGLDIDVMNNPSSKFYEIGKATFAPNYFVKLFMLLQPFLAPLYKKLGLNLIPERLAKFFSDAVDQTLEYREKNNVSRPDYLHLLNELKKRDEEMVKEGKLDPEDSVVFDHKSLISNAFVFFAAGYETTASSLSYIFYELALDQNVQEKLYEEIVDVLSHHEGEINVAAIGDMQYLEQVVSEGLRKHPPGVMIERKITKDYLIPGTDVTVPAGIQVIVPVYGIHHDPQYYPQPEKFIPERFDLTNGTVTKGTYLPFGAGPRMCIAARFARLEVKVCVAAIIKNYRVRTCSKTTIPVQYDQRAFMLSPKNGITLSLEKRVTATQ